MISRIAAPSRTFTAEGATRGRAHLHCTRHSGPCAGFTLIEAVVALAVVAVLLAAIGAVVTTSARGTQIGRAHV